MGAAGGGRTPEGTATEAPVSQPLPRRGCDICFLEVQDPDVDDNYMFQLMDETTYFWFEYLGAKGNRGSAGEMHPQKPNLQ